MALIDTNLVVRYYCDEGADGTSAETDLLDASGVGTDFDLAINYGTSDAEFHEDGSGNRAWESLDVDGPMVARKAIAAADKIDDLDGAATKLTVELVIDIATADNGVSRVFGITEPGGEGSLMICHNDTDGILRVNEEEVSFTMPKSAKAVWHFVIDTTQATASDRCKVYKDGAWQADLTVPSLNQNDTLTIQASSFLCMANRANDGSRGVAAKFYYAAIYDGAFSATDCDDNYDVLVADDDTPAAGGADPEARLIGGKLVKGGLLQGRLI